MIRKSFLFLLMFLTASFAVSAQKVESSEVPAGDGSQITFFAGLTSVRLSSDFANALTALQLDARGAFPGRLSRGTASFPITGGTLDTATLRGEIVHSGGLILSKRPATTVKLESFIIDTTRSSGIVLTGLVSANGAVVGRIPLFDLQLPAARGFGFDFTRVQLDGVGVRLRPEAAAALNGVFGTTAFVAGFNIGTASVDGYAFGS